ncbi:MAG: ubiquinol-cytochrome c reductase cytochrome b subunit [Candidatus Nanopelagicales bacterium]|nr:ubiquinol-cytochrome c reductase cytochrome b subunit [Candidatus Nanopelagicales bacterium]
MSAVMDRAGEAVNNLDERLTIGNWAKRNLRKVFPDHWTFMFGEMALYSFIILLLSGIYLSLWFKPSMTEVIYNGSYVPLKGLAMSEAYKTSLDISFDVRGGLLLRQIHHWSAMVFIAAMSIHVMRVFFTGAFRKPREINWSIGVLLLTLGFVEGFAGYSLPDDLLSGTGLRIAQGIMLSIPVVGSYVSFFAFGGEFPGDIFISRLYGIHILLLPGIILALITAHMLIVWYQKHTQYPGKGKTNDNVVGYPFMPVYMAKAGGFFFVVFGVVVAVSGLVTINPIWAYGPYVPDQITAGSQPDWYMGWLEGALRAMPNWETVLWGHTISWNVLIPGALVLGIILTLMALYPFIEAKATGDKREHHLLDRPRNAPTRTALGAMALSFYLMLLIGGGNDVIAHAFDLSINAITWFIRIGIFIIPALVFVVTKRTCLSLQHRDREKLLHGRETGSIMRLPTGEFTEIHAPVNANEKAVILSKVDIAPLPWPEKTDENGVKQPGYASAKRTARLSHWFFQDNVPRPTQEEIAAAEAHILHGAAEGQAIIEHHEQLEPEGGVMHDPSAEPVNK